MKKIILLAPIIFLLFVSISLSDSVIASINVNWQLSFDSLKPNNDATISLTLTNSGSSYLTKVIIKASSGNYVKITSGNENNLGSMSVASSQQSMISIKIDENAPSTISYVLLNVEYYYTETSSYEKTFYIPIKIVRDSILQIENVNFSEALSPGSAINLTFDLKNEGLGSARDIVVSLGQTSDFISTGSSGEYFISKLGNLESSKLTLSLTVSPDAAIGTTTIPVRITYYDETRTNNYTEIKNIGSRITGNIEFISAVSSYNNFYYGRVGSVIITIANRGIAPAEYVSVNARSDFGSKEFYIGKLDSDDSDTIELTQDLTKASDKYPVYLTINYKDRFDNSYSVDETVEVIPSNAPLDYNIFIVVFVVLGIIYWFYRKRKK
jgi:hypothetical protein